MSTAIFIDMVRSMRQAQVNYFKTRDKWQLEKSKSLERQVDKVLAEGITPDQVPATEQNKQLGELF